MSQFQKRWSFSFVIGLALFVVCLVYIPQWKSYAPRIHGSTPTSPYLTPWTVVSVSTLSLALAFVAAPFPSQRPIQAVISKTLALLVFCFGAVFLEGMFLMGIFPYVAVLQQQSSGETSAAMAGLVIAGFALGGVVYSLTVSRLLARIGERLMLLGGGSALRAANGSAGTSRGRRSPTRPCTPTRWRCALGVRPRDVVHDRL